MIDTSLHSCWTVPMVDIANNRDTAKQPEEYSWISEIARAWDKYRYSNSESQQLTGAVLVSTLLVVHNMFWLVSLNYCQNMGRPTSIGESSAERTQITWETSKMTGYDKTKIDERAQTWCHVRSQALKTRDIGWDDEQSPMPSAHAEKIDCKLHTPESRGGKKRHPKKTPNKSIWFKQCL